MTIYAHINETFEATADGAPSGLVGTIGVQITDGAVVVSPRTTSGIVELPANSGVYVATLTAPSDAGDYDVVFDTGGESPVFASEDLIVSGGIYSHSFMDVTPPALFAIGKVWASVEIQQADSSTGDSVTGEWATIDTLSLAADPTPGQPDPLNLTTSRATAPHAWFRFVFIDNDQVQAAPSPPVESPARDAFATDADFTPSTADVAALCGAYTREYVGGYDQQAGREQGDFTSSTTPTVVQVEAFIESAVREVRSRLGYDLLLDDAPLARKAVVWHAAAQVEAKRLPAGSEDSHGAYQAFIGNFAACLGELQTQAKRRLWFVG